ncbi:hypothetical protein [Lentilactobacillus sp. Marseille-Q4993]|uniref:hypothetical protein n=1 Tax=Lentilactobacillus sp. Marseille-Q4993 TaxID=3039492 RepID=UPI0024BC6A5C|nr:hypothetical protein [Lentilactobacillus sp. Marseille-Q4993]
MKPRDTQHYAQVISDVIDFTGTNGEDLNDDFETLRKAVDADNVSDISTEELTRIRDHFQSGTDKYKDRVNQLQQVSVPVRILGRHKTMVSAYTDYANACQAMTDSIKPEESTVDADAFNQSEKDQEASIDRFSKAANRVMTNLM